MAFKAWCLRMAHIPSDHAPLAKASLMTVPDFFEVGNNNPLTEGTHIILNGF